MKRSQIGAWAVMVGTLFVMGAEGCACFLNEVSAAKESVDDDDGDNEGSGDEGSGDEGSRDEGGSDDGGREGEGSSDGADGGGEGFLPPCCDFDEVALNADVLTMELNGAGLAYIAQSDPFTGVDDPRRLLLRVETGATFSTQVLLNDIGDRETPAVVLLANNDVALASNTSTELSFTVIGSENESVIFSSSAPNFIYTFATTRFGPDGVAFIIKTAVTTTHDIDFDCPQNFICRDYGVWLVYGNPGNWTTIALASHLGEEIRATIGIGVGDDGTLMAMWGAGDQIFVAQKVPGIDEVDVMPIAAAGLGYDEAAYAVGRDGTAHAVFIDYDDRTLKHVAGKDGAFVSSTIGPKQYISSIAAAADGTLYIPYVIADESQAASVHLLRARGDERDDVEIATDVADPTTVRVDAFVKLDAQAKPHILVRSPTPKYLRPD